MPRITLILMMTFVLLPMAKNVGASQSVSTPLSAYATDGVTQKLGLRIDVSGKVGAPGSVQIAATAFLPPASLLTDRPVAIFALPGGGTNRNYFDIHLPGREGYSQAEYLAKRGLIFIAIDHLGVGESTKANLDSLHIEDIARANDAAVGEIARRLELGTLAPGYPALPGIYKVGIGHSMGGGLTIIMQGRYGTYDAIAPLGYSAIHTVLPQRSEAERRRGTEGSMRQATRWTDPRTLSLKQSAKATADYVYPFFWDDVPRDIIDADLGGGSPGQPSQAAKLGNWSEPTIPNCVIAMMSPGYVAEEAALVRVPVLIMLGERDVVPNPLAEPAADQSASDIGVVIIPRMAHNHNFASTRQQLWDRLADWARSVSRSPK